MSRTEIRIGGFGGQGVILAGIITGHAAAIHDDKFATMTQSFGPEARGSACSSQVVISDEPVLYPYVAHPNLLVVMSQEAATKFIPGIAENALVLYEKDLVKLPELPEGVRAYGINATRIAEELRRKVVLNIVMVGFLTAVSKVVSRDAARSAVEDTVPKGTEMLNLKAFDMGYEEGEKALAEA